MNNFTPGPWITEQQGEPAAGSFVILTDKGWEEGYPWIATVHGTNVGPKSDEVVSANAHLIVTAPQLYEALKLVDQEFDRLFRALPEEAPDECYPNADIRNLIDDLIAKADGLTETEHHPKTSAQ